MIFLKSLFSGFRFLGRWGRFFWLFLNYYVLFLSCFGSYGVWCVACVLYVFGLYVYSMYVW